MSQRTINNSPKLAKQIKSRRQELNLTIEEAASLAGVGTKTWCRYEAGEAIRQDKGKGICVALKWKGFPDDNADIDDLSVEEFRGHEAWSTFLAETFGDGAAASFAIGSDILLDYINEDMSNLASMPKGTHLGQLGTSFLEAELPEQFLMRYDYEFLYALKITVLHLRKVAKAGVRMVAYSVLEELALYVIVELSRFLMESMVDIGNDGVPWDEWIYDLFDDMDIVTMLYADEFIVREDNTYHFVHWEEEQFWRGELNG